MQPIFPVLVLLAASPLGLPAAETIAPAGTTNTVDLRPAFSGWNLTPRQQGGRPTCSAFTVAVALEYAAAKRQGHGTRLSVEFLNWASNKACGENQDGGFFSDLWSVIASTPDSPAAAHSSFAIPEETGAMARCLTLMPAPI